MTAISVQLFNVMRNRADSARLELASILSCLSISLVSICLSACHSAADGIGILPPAPSDEVKFSAYSPASPYVQQAPGVLSRKAFVASSGAGYRVEVQDLLIGPRQKARSITMPGPAVVEVRGGNAVMSDGDLKRELKEGLTFLLVEGGALLIDNDADHAASLRVHLFIAE